MRYLLLLLLLSACGDSSVGDFTKLKMPVLTVTYLESRDEFCIYSVRDNLTHYSLDFNFVDSCGKYLVGDTIKIVKHYD
jgi:hypothetical protein